MPFDVLLIATGGRNRRISIPGSELEGIYSLRTVEDADRIKAEISAGRRVVVVGMGFIGSEVAASLRQKGLDVVAIEPAKTPLFRVLGEAVGQQHRRPPSRSRRPHDLRRHGRRVRRDTARGAGHHESVACAWTATSWWPGSASSRSWTSSMALVFTWTTGSSSTSTARRMSLASTRQVTSRITITPYSSGRSGWSTGTTPSSKALLLRATCSARLCRTTRSTGSGRTNTKRTCSTPVFTRSGTSSSYVGASTPDSFLAFYINDGRIDAVVGLNRAKDVRRAIPLIKARRKLNLGQLQDESIDLRSLNAAD